MQTFFDDFRKFYTWFISKLERITNGRYWLWKVTGVSFFAVMIFSCPRISEMMDRGLLLGKYSEKDAWYAFERQKDKPFDKTIYEEFSPASHEAKIVF